VIDKEHPEGPQAGNKETLDEGGVVGVCTEGDDLQIGGHVEGQTSGQRSVELGAEREVGALGGEEDGEPSGGVGCEIAEVDPENSRTESRHELPGGKGVSVPLNREGLAESLQLIGGERTAHGYEGADPTANSLVALAWEVVEHPRIGRSLVAGVEPNFSQGVDGAARPQAESKTGEQA
jgi:hypothetical protein